MENLQKDDTVKFFVIIGIVFGAINGWVSLMKFIEEKQIARKQLEHIQKSKSNK
jgi:hypothetical protein